MLSVPGWTGLGNPEARHKRGPLSVDTRISGVYSLAIECKRKLPAGFLPLGFQDQPPRQRRLFLFQPVKF
jgi:hypothetical protein